MRTSLVLSLALAFGCSEPRDPGGAFLSLQLRLPAGLVNITGVTVVVYDEGGSCNGADARGGNELVRQSIPLDMTTRVEVSTGARTVSAIALDGTVPVARGCQQVTVSSDQVATAMINLVEYPPGPDAPPDAPIIDAPPVPDGMTPPEDECDTPGTVAGNSTPVNGTLANATDDVDLSCGVSGAADVFYEITIGTPSEVDFRAADGSGQVAVAVFSGGCGVLAEMACASGANPDVLTDVPLPTGTYLVVVEEQTAGSGGTFTLTATSAAVPPTDDCGNPGTITLNTPLNGDYGDAADDTAASCGGAGGRDEVYRLSVPDSQYVRVTGSNSNYALSVRDVCNDVGSEVGTPLCDATDPRTIDLGLVQGEYFVWVDRTGGGPQTFTLNATTQPPPNDVCPGTLITPGTTVNGTLIGANNTTTASCGGTGNDVFYTFTTAADQHLVATVTAASAATNPVLSIRTDCTVAGSELAGGCSNASTNETETLDVPLLPAGTYTLVVDAQGTPSSFQLTLALSAPMAANDTCATARTLTEPGLTAQSVQFAADNVNGTGECSDAGATDVVYSFTTGVTGDVTISVTPTNFDTAIYVRSDVCMTGTQSGCADAGGSGGAETVTLTGVPAGTYYLFVEKKAGAGTAFDIGLTLP